MLLVLIASSFGFEFMRERNLQTKKINQGVITSIQGDSISVNMFEETNKRSNRNCRIRSLDNDFSTLTCIDDDGYRHFLNQVSPFILRNNTIGDTINISLPIINSYPRVIHRSQITNNTLPQVGNYIYFKPSPNTKEKSYDDQIFSSDKTKSEDYFCITSNSIFDIKGDKIYYLTLKVQNLSDSPIVEGRVYLARGSINIRDPRFVAEYTINSLQDLNIQEEEYENVKRELFLKNCNNMSSKIPMTSYIKLKASEKYSIDILTLAPDVIGYNPSIPSISREEARGLPKVFIFLIVLIIGTPIVACAGHIFN